MAPFSRVFVAGDEHPLAALAFLEQLSATLHLSLPLLFNGWVCNGPCAVLAVVLGLLQCTPAQCRRLIKLAPPAPTLRHGSNPVDIAHNQLALATHCYAVQNYVHGWFRQVPGSQYIDAVLGAFSPTAGYPYVFVPALTGAETPALWCNVAALRTCVTLEQVVSVALFLPVEEDDRAVRALHGEWCSAAHHRRGVVPEHIKAAIEASGDASSARVLVRARERHTPDARLGQEFIFEMTATPDGATNAAALAGLCAAFGFGV